MTGDLPFSWTERRASELCSLITSGSRGWARYYAESGAGFIRVQNVRRGRIDLDLDDLQHVRPPKNVEGSRTRLRPNDVAITITADLGRVGLVGDDLGEAYVNQHVALVRPTEAVVPAYLAWFIAGPNAQQQLGLLDRGATRSGLGLRDIEGLTVPLPSLAEQRRIVARIEALFARIRRARTDLERIAPLSAQYQKSLLEVVFFPENEGSHSSHMRPFFDVLDFKGGTQPPKATFSETLDSGLIRLLQIRDFASDNKAVYIKDSSNWSKCAANDILVGRYGASVGKILRGKAGAYNVALVKMIADWNRVDRNYLFNWLQSSAFQNCVLGVSRSAQNGFNKGDLANLTFPLLDLASQKSVSRRLEAASNAGKAITRDAKHALVLLDRLEQTILARAFRGELVPQNLAEDFQAALTPEVEPVVSASPDNS